MKKAERPRQSAGLVQYNRRTQDIMTKSNIEKQYQKLVIHYISHLEICPEQRAALFLDFHENSSQYYDDLCDILYCASTDDTPVPIWLDPCGEVYLSAHRRNASHTFLMDSKDLPHFKGDLLEHFDYVFTRIYALIGQNTIARPCCINAF